MEAGRDQRLAVLGRGGEREGAAKGPFRQRCFGIACVEVRLDEGERGTLLVVEPGQVREVHAHARERVARLAVFARAAP